MLSMGPKARRAVRALKLRLQGTDPALVISSASDVILKAVGKRGFTGVKSCNVGVPVASAIPSPREREMGKGGHQGKESQELSLADMMKDETGAADEGITKMVAKVGRFWYSRCYESIASAMSTTGGGMGGGASGSRGEGSIFEDRKLLEECENWNSSFKLVVAYAQKPVQGRRRTNSV